MSGELSNLTWIAHTSVTQLYSIHYKVLTYVEYRDVSCVFRNIDHPTPLHPASVSSPRTKDVGVHTRRAVGRRGVNILEDVRHWIGLLQYHLSTVCTVHIPVGVHMNIACIAYTLQVQRRGRPTFM